MINGVLGWIDSFIQGNEMQQCHDEFQKQIKLVREQQEKINISKLEEIIKRTEALENEVEAIRVATETLIKKDRESTKAQHDHITSIVQKTLEDCGRLSYYR